MTVGVQTGMTGDLFYDYSRKSPFGGTVAWTFTLFSGFLRGMAHPAVSIDLEKRPSTAPETHFGT